VRTQHASNYIRFPDRVDGQNMGPVSSSLGILGLPENTARCALLTGGSGPRGLRHARSPRNGFSRGKFGAAEIVPTRGNAAAHGAQLSGGL
jgi:hypothetical protein